jgi:hypothetical protein
MKIHMTSVFALATTVLLCTTAAQAGAHKAVGGLVGGASNLGKALDGINLQGALDNLAPTPGAIPNVRGAPNISNAVPSGQALPNIAPAAPNNAVPNIQGSAPIYDAVPQRPQGNGIYEAVDAPLGDAPIYDVVRPVSGNGVYEAVDAPLGGPNIRNAADNTYTLAPPPVRGGDPNYMPLRQLNAPDQGIGIAADLPSPPTGFPSQPIRNAGIAPNGVAPNSVAPNGGAVPGGAAANPPAANPGFFKRNKKAIGGAAAGIGLAGAGVGGYYIAEDVAKDQNDDDTDESKITNAYEDSKEWAEGAVQTIEGWF